VLIEKCLLLALLPFRLTSAFFTFFRSKQIRACVALLDIAMEETKSADVNEHFDRFMYARTGLYTRGCLGRAHAIQTRGRFSIVKH
jgi:hypothetical protein